MITRAAFRANVFANPGGGFTPSTLKITGEKGSLEISVPNGENYKKLRTIGKDVPADITVLSEGDLAPGNKITVQMCLQNKDAVEISGTVNAAKLAL